MNTLATQTNPFCGFGELVPPRSRRNSLEERITSLNSALVGEHSLTLDLAVVGSYLIDEATLSVPYEASKLANFPLTTFGKNLKLVRPSSEVKILESKLTALQSDEDETAPSTYAKFQAEMVLLPAYNFIFAGKSGNARLPKPVVTTDDAGGIMVSWRSENSYLLVNIGAASNKKSFMYFSEGEAGNTFPLDEVGLRSKLQAMRINTAKVPHF